MPSVNEYDTFQYFESPDYVPLLRQRHKEENEGFARAEEMARLNDKQRLANAKMMDRNINQFYKLSGTLAKVYEKHRDEKDVELQNNARLLARESGATLKGLTEYNKREEQEANYVKDTGYYYNVADRLDKEGKHDVANKIRSLTGHKAVIFKETLARRAGNNWRSNFYNNVGGIEIEYNGEQITWANADTTDKQQAVIREYNKNAGLSEISGLSDAFLDKHFWPQVEQAEANIISERAKQNYNEQVAAQHAEIQDQLLVAAETGPEALGAKFLNTNRLHAGLYKDGQPGARKAQLDTIFDMLGNGLIDPSQVEGLPNYEFVPDGQTKPVKLGEYYRREFADFDSRLNEAKKQHLQKYFSKQETDRLAFTQQMQEQKKENKRPFTEAELREFKKAWESDPTRGSIPDYLKNEFNRSAEDRSDEDIALELDYKMRYGLPITQEDIDGIYNLETKQQWETKLANYGGGIPKSLRDRRDQILKSSVGSYLGETIGSEDKTPQYYHTLHNAEDYYRTQYAHHVEVGELKPSQAHAKALEETTTALNNGLLNAPPSASGSQRYSEKIGTVKNELVKAKESGQGNTYLSTTIIPGTEADNKILLTYMDGKGGRIPSVYRTIARLTKLTTYEIAAAQYRAATGKEPPPPPSNVKRISEMNPNNKLLYTWRTSHNRQKRAEINESNEKTEKKVSWNAEELLNSNLTEIWQNQP